MADITPLHDILDDLRDRLVSKLQKEGLSVPDKARKEVDSALIAVLRVPHRSIEPRPRQVHSSKALEARRRELNQETLDALQVVVDELRKGNDVTQRLTRKHFKAGFNDRIHNDLGVQHLHLGSRNLVQDATGQHAMCEGHDELLWVIVRPDDVYLLDVLRHGAFATYDFGQVVYDNWKYLLGEPLEGWTDDADVLSAEVRAMARRAGLSTVLTINGEDFLPGGYACDGTSTRVVSVADHLLNKVGDTHKWLEENLGTVLDMLEEVTGTRPPGLDLRVGDLEAFIQRGVSLAEAKTGGTFIVTPEGIHFSLMRPEFRAP